MEVHRGAFDRIEAYKPRVVADTNDKLCWIQSRDPTLPRLRAQAVSSLDEVPTVQPGTLVVVDEGQFMGASLVHLSHRLRNDGVALCVAGLDLDFRRRTFGCMLQLAETPGATVHQLTARCDGFGQGCDRRALYSLRTSSAQELILTGSEHYRPVCELHYNALQPDT